MNAVSMFLPFGENCRLSSNMVVLVVADFIKHSGLFLHGFNRKSVSYGLLKSVLSIVLWVTIVSAASEAQETDAKTDRPQIVSDVFKFRIGFESGTHAIDLGEILPHSEYRLRFEFTNDFAAPLAIRKIETSCGCMKEHAVAQAVKPGDKGNFDILFKSPGLPGTIQKAILLRFDENGDQNFRLRLVGSIKPVFMVSSGPIEIPQSGSVSVTLSNSGTVDRSISKIEPLKNLVFVEDLKENFDAQKWTISLSGLQQRSSQDSDYEMLRVSFTEGSKIKMCDLPIRIHFESELSVYPTTAFVKPGGDGNSEEIRLIVRGAGGSEKNFDSSMPKGRC